MNSKNSGKSDNPVSHFRLIAIYDIFYTIMQIVLHRILLRPIQGHRFTSTIVIGLSCFFLFINVTVLVSFFIRPVFSRLTTFYIFFKMFFFKFTITNHIINQAAEIANSDMGWMDWFNIMCLMNFADVTFLVFGITQIYSLKNGFYNNRKIEEKKENIQLTNLNNSD